MMKDQRVIIPDDNAKFSKELETSGRLGPFDSKYGKTYIYFMRLYLREIFPDDNYDIHKKKIKEESRNYVSKIVCDHPGLERVMVIVPQEFYEEVSKIDVEIAGKFKVYDENSVSFDPTENIYVPKHELASQEEIDDMKKKILLDDNEKVLPFILDTDPICKWYGFKSGDILRITRNEEIYYRIVHKKKI